MAGFKSLVWLEMDSLFYFRARLQDTINIPHLAYHWASLCSSLDISLRITPMTVTMRYKIWGESCDVSLLGMRL